MGVSWSLTLNEEHRLRVFESRVLRKTFGPKREVKRDWNVLHNEELHVLQCPPNSRVVKSTRRRWVGHVSRM
jgi:hypothetical protein